ncbi:MAG: hypothetical protein Q8Q06_04355 [bacterium]|nr:hypothetical protein [bacterium]
MQNGMLGNVSLSDFQGPRDDFEQKLTGPDGKIWLAAFKRFLRKENPWAKLLVQVDEVEVLGTTRFVAADMFGPNNYAGIKFFLGDSFKENFLGKIEKRVPATDLAVHILVRQSLDRPIIDELGGGREETFLYQLYELISRQPKGEDGPLLVDGKTNIFYIRDAAEVLWAVNVDWDSHRSEWNVNAYSTAHLVEWEVSRQVFSQVSPRS